MVGGSEIMEGEGSLFILPEDQRREGTSQVGSHDRFSYEKAGGVGKRTFYVLYEALGYFIMVYM